MEDLANPFRPRSRLNRTPPSGPAKGASSLRSPLAPLPFTNTEVSSEPGVAEEGGAPMDVSGTPAKVPPPASPIKMAPEVAMPEMAPETAPSQVVEPPMESDAPEPPAALPLPPASPAKAASPVKPPSPVPKLKSPSPVRKPATPPPRSSPAPPPAPSPPKPTAPVSLPAPSSATRRELGGITAPFDLRKMTQSLRAPSCQAPAPTPTPPLMPPPSPSTSISTTTTATLAASPSSSLSSAPESQPTPPGNSPATPMPNPFVRRPKVARTPPQPVAPSVPMPVQDGDAVAMPVQDDVPLVRGLRPAPQPQVQGQVEAPTQPSTAPQQQEVSQAMAPAMDVSGPSAMLMSPPPKSKPRASLSGQASSDAMLISPAPKSKQTSPAPKPRQQTSPVPKPRQQSSRRSSMDLQAVVAVRDTLAAQQAELKTEVGILKDRLGKQRAESERLLQSWNEAHDAMATLQEERGVLAKEVTELRMRLEPSEELTKQADDQIKGLRLHELELRVQLCSSTHHLHRLSARERKLKVLMLQQEARTHELKGAFSRDYWAICAFGCNVSRKVVSAMGRMEATVASVGEMVQGQSEAQAQAQQQLEAQYQAMLRQKEQQAQDERDKCLETLRQEAEQRLAQVTSQADQEVKKYEALLQDKLREISLLEQSLADLQLRGPPPSMPESHADPEPMQEDAASPAKPAKSSKPSKSSKAKQAQSKRGRDRTTPASTLDTPVKGTGKAPFASPDPKRTKPAAAGSPSPIPAIPAMSPISAMPQGGEEDEDVMQHVEQEEVVEEVVKPKGRRAKAKDQAVKEEEKQGKAKAKGRERKPRAAEKVVEEEEVEKVEEVVEERMEEPKREGAKTKANRGKKANGTRRRKDEPAPVEAAVEVEEEEVPTQPFDVTDDVGAFAESHDVGDDAGMGGGEWDDDNENTMQVSPFKPSHPVDHPTQVEMPESTLMEQSPLKPAPRGKPTQLQPASHTTMAGGSRAAPLPMSPPKLRARQGVKGLPPAPKSLAPADAKAAIKKLSLFAAFKDKASIPKLKPAHQRPPPGSST